jgi:hypothetical protein
MRFTVWIPEALTLELNYMWHPTFIGMNPILKKELEDAIMPMVQNKELTETLLDEVDRAILELLVQKFPIDGLADYLCALSRVKDSA